MLLSNLRMTIMSVRFFITPFAIVSILAGAIALSGCRTHKRVATEPASPPQSVSKDEASNKIPDDLYKDMPMYPGLQVTHVRKPRGAMREILFEVPGSPQFNQMIGFYKEELKKNNFRITSSLIMAARKTWSCDFNKDGRPGSIKLYPDDKDKSVEIIDLIYEVPSHVDQALLEPKEDFDVIGPGRPGTVALQAPNKKVKRN